MQIFHNGKHMLKGKLFTSATSFLNVSCSSNISSRALLPTVCISDIEVLKLNSLSNLYFVK